jgi:hypothetical protein
LRTTLCWRTWTWRIMRWVFWAGAGRGPLTEGGDHWLRAGDCWLRAGDHWLRAGLIGDLCTADKTSNWPLTSKLITVKSIFWSRPLYLSIQNQFDVKILHFCSQWIRCK